jgi:hypothetical protein
VRAAGRDTTAAEREEFRAEAAEELGVAPQDVELTREGDRIEAEPALTEDQRFLDGLTGGAFAGVAETADRQIGRVVDVTGFDEEARADAAEAARTGVVLPSLAAGAAVAEGADRLGVGLPEVDTTGVRETADEAVETAGEGVILPAAASATAVEEGAERMGIDTDAVEAEVDATIDEVRAEVDRFSGREAGETIRETAGRAADAGEPLAEGAVAPAAATATAVEVGGDALEDRGIGAEEAATAGAAGIVTPEPLSTGTGIAVGAVAAGALAVGAARRSELEIPDPEEIGVGLGGAEIDAPEGRREETVELPLDETAVEEPPELSVPTDGAVTVTELDAPERPPDDTGELGAPTVEASPLLGGETAEEDTVDEDDSRFITEETLVDPDDRTGELARQQQEQALFENRRRFGDVVRDSVPEAPREEVPGEIDEIDDGIAGVGEPETAEGGELFGERFDRFIDEELRDVDDVTTVDREAVRLPGEEATGTDVGVLPEFDPGLGLDEALDTSPATDVGPTQEPIGFLGPDTGPDTGTAIPALEETPVETVTTTTAAPPAFDVPTPYATPAASSTATTDALETLTNTATGTSVGEATATSSVVETVQPEQLLTSAATADVSRRRRRPRTPDLDVFAFGEEDASDRGTEAFTFGFDPEVGLLSGDRL